MLDLSQVAGQIDDAGRSEGERRTRAAEETARAVEHAQSLNGADRWEPQIDRIRASRTSWLVAHSVESPARRIAAPAAPEAYVVVATDGSQIAPDRHEGVGGCYLLNVGKVFLPYGTNARARLSSVAEILIADDVGDEEDDATARAQMSQRRFGREMAVLAGLITEAGATGLPSMAMMDGSLIAWFLEDREGKDAAKAEAFAALLCTLETARSAAVPIVGYVSGSASRDVVNALRVTLCPDNPVSCFPCPHPKDAVPCEPIQRATDVTLFAGLLGFGERSPVFTAQGQVKGFSKVLPMYGDQQWIAFFYVNVGSEIARVEFPTWVGEDERQLTLIHAVCLDQACKGSGYPVALSEAHEQAVVHGADRQAFLNLLRRAMVRAGMPVAYTRKALAKRTRAV